MRLKTFAYSIPILLFLSCATKLVYVPPSLEVSPRVGFLRGETVDLVFFDSRTGKEKFSELKLEIIHHIRRSYPDATFNVLGEDQFYIDADSGRLTIKISVAAYAAKFGSEIQTAIGSIGGDFGFGVMPKNKWNGATGFSVNIFDHRTQSGSKMTKDIGRLVSKSNLWGYRSGRKALEESYQAAMRDLLLFVDASLLN